VKEVLDYSDRKDPGKQDNAEIFRLVIVLILYIHFFSTEKRYHGINNTLECVLTFPKAKEMRSRDESPLMLVE